MSGLCGWLGTHPIRPDQRAWTDAMAAPLIRLAGKPAQLCAGKCSALATTSRGDKTDIFQDEKLLVAIVGTPHWSDTSCRGSHATTVMQRRWPRVFSEAAPMCSSHSKELTRLPLSARTEMKPC